MRTRLVGGMAAIAERAATLEDVVCSISKQLDKLYIYLNDFKECPAFFSSYKNVMPILGATACGDLNANGKMYFLQYEKEGLALTLDDDCIYPPHYALAFLKIFELFKRPVMACVHGSVFASNPKYYYERAMTFDGRKSQHYNNIVTLCGSGTAAFPIELVHGSEHDFFSETYVDLQLSLLAHRAKMPLVSIARPDNWLHFLGYHGLFQKTQRYISHHTKILKENVSLIQWEYIRALWREFLSSFASTDWSDIATKLELSPASIDFLNGHEYYNGHSAVLQMDKLIEFSQNLHCIDDPDARDNA